MSFSRIHAWQNLHTHLQPPRREDLAKAKPSGEAEGEPYRAAGAARDGTHPTQTATTNTTHPLITQSNHPSHDPGPQFHLRPNCGYSVRRVAFPPASLP